MNLTVRGTLSSSVLEEGPVSASGVTCPPMAETGRAGCFLPGGCWFFCFFFWWVGLEFELRASCLQGRCSTT
jgi:hypothetical protein